MYVRSQTAWFDRGYHLKAVSNGARRHSLFKTYHGREMAAGAMLSEETSAPLCFLLKPEAGVMPRFDDLTLKIRILENGESCIGHRFSNETVA
jgi:hypothetical protein